MDNKQDSVSFFQSIRGRLKLFVSSIVPPDEVDDIVQETYLKVWQHQQEKTASINKSFIYKVAKNLAIDFLRKPQSQKNDSVEDESEFGFEHQDSTYQQVEADEQFLLFCQLVRQLPPQCRKIFIMKKVYGMRIKEIADELELSSRTVEVQLQRGYVKFQALVHQAEASEQGDFATMQGRGRRHD
ncbi:sigma-70 family RNA polymerase sigma factor [Catenovulum sp. 2E275]|uniref:sigma-70 family RNA polymerase sigma factor n=1 Tax=Catenovulum sp. 2E275 TaxID=2980497 RepID=UPI0021CDF4FB|nr:sigma-70 family RNA polymerase sigma factor [Catenovulum sp. 2E275]MCU4676547.1 sigma-70 family RNA polymerase sigma factor [Catenovulum sp. 2E275]